MTIAPSARSPRRYQSVFKSFTVGVVKLNWYGSASRRPLTAIAVVSTVTSYLVANGNGGFTSGVKINVVVPDQRKLPGIAGLIWTNEAVTRAGIRPSTTMGSENTTRISLASSRLAISPSGAALTTVSLAGSPTRCSARTGVAAATRIHMESPNLHTGRKRVI